MKFRTAGTEWSSVALPLFEAEAGGAAAAEATAAAAAAAAGGANGTDGAGEWKFDAGKSYEGLDTDNLAWLQKNEPLMADPKALAKHAFNQEKLLGNAIRIPGKDAPQEEKDAFLNKLGRPEAADKYQLAVPKDMPEGLPYDGEFAKRAGGLAHKLGLTQEQFAGLHDFFVGEQVETFKGLTAKEATATTERATKATEALTKLWGPLDGQTARANLEIADQVFTQTKGGQDFLTALKEIGLVGPNKEILDIRIAPFIASLGTALYTEDGILRGSPDVVGNPFDSTSDSFNVTEQMKLAKSDKPKALSLMRAAGKKPEDFGLPANFGA